MATPKKYFFYLIVTAHYFLFEENFVQMIGYGVTGSPSSRVRKYSNASGGEQEFRSLWYSPSYQVMELEKILKKRIMSDTHTINGEEVEWISPSSNIKIDDLKLIVESIIKEFKLDLRPIKDEYLPFNDSDWQKEINHTDIQLDPDQYLDPKLVDKTKK